jgi:hypothetical protein
MPDDLIDMESSNPDQFESAEQAATSSYGLGRWAHFPAMGVFGILFVLMHDHPWRWYVAIDGAYTVYVFGFAIGSIIKDFDDFFGSPEIQRCALKQMIPHVPILAVLNFGIFLWFHLNTILPALMTTEGRKESLFEFLGWVVLAAAGITQGIWMAKRIKSQLNESTAD